MLHRLAPLILLSTVLLAAGCVTPATTPPDADDTLETAATLTPTTEEITGSVQLALATPARSFNYGGTFSTPLTLTETLEGVIIEVEWTPETPLSENLAVWVREAGAGSVPPSDPMDLVEAPAPIATADGASPLRIVLEKGAFEAGDYEILVRADAAPVGAAVEQPYTLFVTTFAEGVAFDGEFTALAPEE